MLVVFNVTAEVLHLITKLSKRRWGNILLDDYNKKASFGLTLPSDIAS